MNQSLQAIRHCSLLYGDVFESYSILLIWRSRHTRLAFLHELFSRWSLLGSDLAIFQHLEKANRVNSKGRRYLEEFDNIKSPFTTLKFRHKGLWTCESIC